MSAEIIHFHGDDVKPSPPEKSHFHILPVPFEQSVSYGRGTAKGPMEILKASCQLELLTCGVVPADHGIHTYPVVDCTGSAEKVLERIYNQVVQTLTLGSIPVMIGGEHTVTLGAVAALSDVYGDFGIIQFDAHADLRDSYHGSKYSHASVMRRICEWEIPILQIGTRSYAEEEHLFRQENDIIYFDAEDIWQDCNSVFIPDDFPDIVYISFDVDVFDSSIMPATGTPVPGGLQWYQTMKLLQNSMSSRRCCGFDVVEYSPISNFHAYSFSAAQLVYNMMAFIVKNSWNKRSRLQSS